MCPEPQVIAGSRLPSSSVISLFERPSRVAVCFNGSAGAAGAIEARVREARSRLWGYEFEWAAPGSLAEYQGWLANLNSERLRAVVLVGGDGTLNRALPALARLSASGVALIGVPAGTANDLAREWGWRASWDHVQRLLDHGVERTQDLLEANGVPFSTVGGLGVGARLLTEFDHLRSSFPWARWVIGPLRDQIYTVLSVKSLLMGRGLWQRLRVSTRGFNETLRVAAVFVCNQSTVGGDLRVSEDSDPTDGRFELVILTSGNRLELLESLVRFKQGRFPSGAIQLSRHQVTLESESGEPIRFFGDGEILVESGRIELGVRPQALRVLR